MAHASTFGMGARHVRELAAFRLCEELMRAVEAATANGTVASDRRFCDQLNDAALDATSDVGAGFVRYYPREFARFLDYALASLEEVRIRVEAGYRKGYFNVSVTSDLLHTVAKAQRAIRNLRAYLWTVKRFCHRVPCGSARFSRLGALFDRLARTMKRETAERGR